MAFLFISLACFAAFGAVFAITAAIDHFASIWETADASTWRGRFSARIESNNGLNVAKGLSGMCMALAGFAFLVSVFFALMYGIGGERRFAVYVTGGPVTDSGQTLRQFSATSGELRRLPIFEYVDSRRIVRGRVSSVLPIGGGLVHLCVANGDYCGLADSSMKLKPGDEAFVRIGRPPGSQRRPPGWAITADEAKALTATSAFTIEKK
jgi:hypothetical protein